MGAVLNLVDRLTNALSGRGTTIDRSVYNRYVFMPVTDVEAEAWYRGTWLGRKIIDILPFDMTREGRDWQANAADIEKLEAEEERLGLWFKLQRALTLARLWGGGGIVLGDGSSDSTQPLKIENVRQGGLQYAQVYSRYQLQEGGNQRLDPADPWFGQPDVFTISTATGVQLKLHPSRVIAFIGQRVPEGSRMPGASWFWGDPLYQSIRQAVQNADMGQDGFAGLIDEAKIDILKTPGLTDIVGTTEGEQKIANRVQAANLGKSNYRALLLDAEEDWQQKQISWDGMPDMMMALLQVVCGAADIPVTRLLGTSPKGLQSTGDGEREDYQTMVGAKQRVELAPQLKLIDQMLIPSALGSMPSDVYYEFAPLRKMDEKGAAEIEFKASQTVKNYADTGMIPEAALAKIAQNRIVESGRWPGSETAFEEAANDPLPGEQDNPDQLGTLEQRVAKMEGRGQIAANDAAILLADASPRSLYVNRKLLNADKLVAWAKTQGFETTVPAGEMHVTVLFSRSPVDWMKMGSGWDQDADGKLKVAPGGARLVEPLGDKGAVVLLFSSSALSWRHEEMVRNGASHDYEEYQPHVTITYGGTGLDLSKVEPYRGEFVFGPEIFTEVKEDWEKSLTEE